MGKYLCFLGIHKFKPHFKYLLFDWWGHNLLHEKCSRCKKIRGVSYSEDGYN
jgi:hypothetical protein